MLSPVPVVCNVRAPYSAGWNFRQYFYAVWYLGRPLTFTGNFTEIVPAKYSNFFDISEVISRKRCKIAGKLVLITDMKSYELSIGTKIGNLEWPRTAKWPLFCVILPNLVVSGAHYVTVVDKAITMDNLRLLCLVKHLQKDRATPTAITARWKFCRR